MLVYQRVNCEVWWHLDIPWKLRKCCGFGGWVLLLRIAILDKQPTDGGCFPATNQISMEKWTIDINWWDLYTLRPVWYDLIDTLGGAEFFIPGPGAAASGTEAGKRMYRALHANLHVFSSRQRKFLEKVPWFSGLGDSPIWCHQDCELRNLICGKPSIHQ